MPPLARTHDGSRGARLLVALLLAALSCGGDPDAIPTGPGSSSIALNLSSPRGTVQQGNSTQLVAVVIRSGPFNGAVRFAVEGRPAGVDVAGINEVANGTSTEATLIMSADATTPVGTYNLTIRVSGTGVNDAAAPFVLSVIAPTPATTYTLSLTPSAVSVPQGSSGTVVANLPRGAGYVETVSLSASGVPPGLGVIFAPQSTTGVRSVLGVSAAAGLAPGTYTLSVRGQSASTADQTVVLTVNVIRS
jgi:hypothetical protein